MAKQPLATLVDRVSAWTRNGGPTCLAALAIASTCLLSFPAHAGDTLKRKPGLWEITIGMSRGDRVRTMQQCIDEKTDDIAETQRQGQPGSLPQCEKRDIHRDGNSIVIDTVCRRESTLVTTRATVTGSVDSSYRMESRSRYDPPLRGMTESTTTVDAKWLGPCRPDQKPGEMIIPGMGKFNPQEMRERMQNMPKPQ